MRARILLGSLIVLLALGAAPALAQEIPTVQVVQTSTHPAPPAGWKVACMPNAVNGGASPTCPVLKYNGYTYWAWSDAQNGVAMAIVAYDSHGVAVKQWNRNGARYVWNVTVDDVVESVSFVGQSNATINLRWRELFIPQAGGELTFVNVAAPAINCVFAPNCTVTVTDTMATIPFPPNVTGTGLVQSRTFAGLAGTPGAGKTAYEYRVDMTGATSEDESACVTDLALDFGPDARLSFDATGQLYDAYVITQGGIGSVGLFNVTRIGNKIDFVFARPLCTAQFPYPGLSSYFFGVVSAYAPVSVTANAGWPGLLGEAVAVRAPNHPLLAAHPPRHPLKAAHRPAKRPIKPAAPSRPH